MVATVQVVRLTSTGPTVTDITSVNTRANTSDAHSTNDTASPIRIPTSGTNYSYWVNTRLRITVAPDTLIENVKWYTDGGNSFATAINMRVETATGYTQATGTNGTTGTQLTTGNYAQLADAPTVAFNYVEGTPLSVTATSSVTGVFGDLVVYQTECTPSAPPGESGAETLTWQYDES